MKKRNPKALCGNCPYWDYLDADPEPRGTCLRRSPSVVLAVTEKDQENQDCGMDDIFLTDPRDCAWPQTTEDRVCGEHPNFFVENES